MKLDTKTRELIAIGASVAVNCQPCLTYHYDAALENGADEDAIADAIAMGKLVRKGAAAKMDSFAANVGKETQSRETAEPGSCCAS